MLCSRENCTGCFACYNICPREAITMEEDEYGYIYPIINNDKCINCKLCEKSCPSLNKINLKYPIKCYAARTKDEAILKKSTSGGIATLLAQKIIENGGVVYGAAYNDKCEVNHIRIDDINELDRLQGSKYVHSYIKDAFQSVKKDLLTSKNVLFIGTPCQVAGLRKYLVKKYDNLYTVDIICHGVPSQKFLKEEVKRLNNDSLNIDRVNFRDKEFNCYTFSIVKNKKNIYSQSWNENPYFYTFMDSITYRENCYNCLYAKPERVSDITIGDFWGLKYDSIFYNDREKGVSVVLIITDRGNKLIDLIKSQINIEEREIDEAINGNTQLRQPSKRSKYVDKFKLIYKKNNFFYETYRKTCKKHLLKEKIKSIYIVKYLLKYKRGK